MKKRTSGGIVGSKKKVTSNWVTKNRVVSFEDEIDSVIKQLLLFEAEDVLLRKMEY